MKYITQVPTANQLKTMSFVDKYMEVKEVYKNNPYLSIETITPQDAIYLLNNMHRNRTIKPKNLLIARTMLKQHGWVYGVETIKISLDGLLLDGQHRLTALSELGIIAHNVEIAWNVPKETMHLIDRGVSKSDADIFTIFGYTHAKAITAVVKSLIFGNKLKRTQKSIKEASLDRHAFPTSKGHLALTTEQQESFYNLHRDYIDPILDTFNGYKSKGISFPLLIMGVLVRALKGNYCSIENIDDFLSIYFNAEELGFTPECNQPFLLRKTLLSSTDRHGQRAITLKYKQLQKSFQYFLEKKPLSSALLAPSALFEYEIYPVPDFDFKD